MPILSATAVLMLSAGLRAGRWYFKSQAGDTGVGEGDAVNSAVDWVETMLGGVASNTAHDEFKALLARVDDGTIDPQTKLPRNHDLQKAGADALQGAALALVWQVAERVRLRQPWLGDLREWLERGRAGRFFSENAIAGVPSRAWVARVHALLAAPGALR
ncbi:MAG: hypothetical protein H7067_02175, partial [Burkholderiales bacterium]|nr:hypothetical protein [Opitutaceae bacterium]